MGQAPATLTEHTKPHKGHQTNSWSQLPEPIRVTRLSRWRYNYEMRLQPIVAVHFDVNDTTDSTVEVSFRLALAEEFRR